MTASLDHIASESACWRKQMIQGWSILIQGVMTFLFDLVPRSDDRIPVHLRHAFRENCSCLANAELQPLPQVTWGGPLAFQPIMSQLYHGFLCVHSSCYTAYIHTMHARPAHFIYFQPHDLALRPLFADGSVSITLWVCALWICFVSSRPSPASYKLGYSLK
jgi:hypothetical protein